jgi:glycosyltransferase involved in cell wall biosynthesis
MAPPDNYVARIERLGVTFCQLNKLKAKGTNPIQDIKLIREIIRNCQREKIDVIFTYTAKGNIFGCLAARQCRVEALPTVNGLGHAFQENGMLQLLMINLYRIAFRKCPVVFVQNADDAALLIEAKAITEKQCQIVPGSGVDLTAFPKSISSPGLNLRFLMSARLVKEKGISNYLDMAKVIVEKYDNVEFNLLGMTADNPSAISIAEVTAHCVHPRISYLGYTDDMNAAFDQCHVFVLPSYYREGIPRVLLEALAKGKPIITTDSVGCREVIRSGQNGFLVIPRSTSSLIEACEKMITLSPLMRKNFGKESRKLAEAKFDEDMVIGHMIARLNDLSH